MIVQMVQRMDHGSFPSALGVDCYPSLWAAVQKAMLHTHVESSLKQEVIQEPEKYVQLDPDTVAALLDMKEAGKTLMLITNSDWEYTRSMMTFAYDRCASPVTVSRCSSSPHDG